MTTLLTPGLYRQPLDPVRPQALLARADIPILLGYARRGPVGVPVRVFSSSQFEEVFGPALDHGFLWHSVNGFFETGGDTAYAMRIAPAAARTATVMVRAAGAVPWAARASFPWPMIDPRRLGPADRSAPVWVQLFEHQVDQHGPRSPDPGRWANNLSIRVRRASRVNTETIVDHQLDGSASRVASLSGLEAHSILELSQLGEDDNVVTAARVPRRLDPDRQLVTWHAELASDGLDPERPIAITSVEFDIDVFSAGRLTQAFRALSPHPDHSFAIARTMRTECRDLSFEPELEPGAGNPADGVDWADEHTWPGEGVFELTGGTDGLEEVTAQTWRDSLPTLRRVIDAALVAGPDLVLPDTTLAQPASVPAPAVDCHDLSPALEGQLAGLVTTVTDDGDEVPVSGVSVDIAGPGGVTTTDADGGFRVTGISVGLVEVRLTKVGFEPLQAQTQSSPFASATPARFTMARITRPNAMTFDEVVAVQLAMADPEIVGPYKIALVDPPAADDRIEQIGTWRARLGGSARIGLFAPWLTLPADGATSGTVTGGTSTCPPSGHVAGAFAAAERVDGVHRSGANRPLRYVDGTTLAISDLDHERLNPIGINAIRALPGRGIRVFGSRTLSSDREWRFLTARRVVDAIEKSLEQALRWMVFEPNDIMTRHAVSITAATLLNRLHREGVLAGDRPEASYSVKCDLENNPEEGRDAGQLVVDIAVAPTEPYEFVVFRMGHAYDAIHVTERPQ